MLKHVKEHPEGPMNFKNYSKNKCLLVCSLFFCSTFLVAQTSSQCARSLSEAELAFEQGRLSDILDDFSDKSKGFGQCLENGVFNAEEEIRAYKLLTKAYLFQDNEKAAEEMFFELLKVDKEHQLAAEDPAELHFLYSKYRTEPIIRIAFKFGFNKTFISTIQSFNTFQSGEKFYNEQGDGGLGIGQSFEFTAERHLGKGLEVGAGLQLRFATYEIDGEIIPEDLTYLAKNRSTMMRVPILFRYNYGYSAKDEGGNRKKLIPYVFLGGSYDITLDATYVDTSRTGGTAFTLTTGNGSLTNFNQVRMSNVSIFGGMGFKYRVGRSLVDFFTLELRYDNSLFNYIDPENRWANDDVRFGIGHVEDDLTINTLTISVGYTRSFYKPKKRKEYR